MTRYQFMKIQIYHNPKCSKSRATLALLRERGLEPEVIEYLKSPPDWAELESLLEKLGMRARDLVRRGEDAYKALGLDEQASSDQAYLRALVAHPILLQRPIVVNGQRARIGRPPESVCEILD